MTTYRRINETETSVGAPLTQQLLYALSANMLAYREGDATLPLPISFKAFHSLATPQAGEVMVAQVVGHFVEPDSSALSIFIRRDGLFKVRCTARMGSSSVNDSEDGDRNPATMEYVVKMQRKGVTSTIGTQKSVNSSKKGSDTFDFQFEKDDFIYVDVDEPLSPIEATVVLSIGVADTNALWGCDAIGRIT